MEDVHESINAEENHPKISSFSSGNNTVDKLKATKELLQSKILGFDETRANSIAMAPKTNRMSQRIPTSYQWKDNLKNGKDIVCSSVNNDDLESPCVWTSSTKR